MLQAVLKVLQGHWCHYGLSHPGPFEQVTIWTSSLYPEQRTVDTCSACSIKPMYCPGCREYHMPGNCSRLNQPEGWGG